MQQLTGVFFIARVTEDSVQYPYLTYTRPEKVSLLKWQQMEIQSTSSRYAVP
jgi:hypothetical protein